MLKDTRFILVRAKCPYVQSTVAARVISTERFVVGGTNRRERDRSQVSNGKVERALRAWLLLSCVLCGVWCVELICPLSGVPYPPFYRSRGAGLTNGRKGKNQRQRRSFKGAGSSFSFEPALLTRQTVLGIACSVILIGPCSGFVQQVVTSHPAPAGAATHQGAESRPYGEQTA